MSRINDKLGLRPAGVRAMMKLPRTRAAAAALTSAKCPSCGQRGARLSKTHPGDYACSTPGCGTHWTPQPTDTPKE